MPFPMKVQPIGSELEFRDTAKPPPVLKSRLKRLFDRPFNSVLKGSSADKPPPVSGEVKDAAGVPEFEPSSVCLDKMVQSFLEENPSEKPPTAAAQKCGRTRCNCFNGNSNDSSDDEFDFGFADSGNNNSSFGDSAEALKSLIPCSSTVERNLLADTSRIVEKNKSCKRKDELRKIVIDGLSSLGFNASICKSKWEKTSSIPSGEYEYIDVFVEGERVLIDVDFRSEFEVARSTGSYKAILQSLPFIFVGGSDRLQQIIAIVSEAARLSLKKKGMHIAPWRKAEYIQAKWLSPHVRAAVPPPPPSPPAQNDVVLVKDTEEGVVEEVEFEEFELVPAQNDVVLVKDTEEGVVEEVEFEEFELVFGEKSTTPEPPSPKNIPAPVKVTWQPPVMKPLSCERSNRVMVTGLASLLGEKP